MIIIINNNTSLNASTGRKFLNKDVFIDASWSHLFKTIIIGISWYAGLINNSESSTTDSGNPAFDEESITY